MNIQEAVKNALEGNMTIYRESAKGECEDIYAVIKPTNTYDTCLLVVKTIEGDKKSCRSWNPTADDLIADDWEVLRNKF